MAAPDLPRITGCERYKQDDFKLFQQFMTERLGGHLRSIAIQQFSNSAFRWNLNVDLNDSMAVLNTMGEVQFEQTTMKLSALLPEFVVVDMAVLHVSLPLKIKRILQFSLIAK